MAITRQQAADELAQLVQDSRAYSALVREMYDLDKQIKDQESEEAQARLDRVRARQPPLPVDRAAQTALQWKRRRLRETTNSINEKRRPLQTKWSRVRTLQENNPGIFDPAQQRDLSAARQVAFYYGNPQPTQ